MQKYGDQRSSLNNDQTNTDAINHAPVELQQSLSDMASYTDITITASGETESSARYLGQQTSGKQIKVFSTRDLGRIRTHITSTGDNCLIIKK